MSSAGFNFAPGRGPRQDAELHMLVGCPMSDAQLYLRILHGRITWQRSYTIAQCTRHPDAWAALPATSRSIMQVQDTARL